MVSRLRLDQVSNDSEAIFRLICNGAFFQLICNEAIFQLICSKDVGVSSEFLNEDLHTSSQSGKEMEGGFLLDVVVGEGSSILELLSSEDKSLRISLQALFVLDYLLNFLNGVSWLDLEGDGLSVQSYDKDLHHGVSSSFGRVHLVKNGEMLNVVIG